MARQRFYRRYKTSVFTQTEKSFTQAPALNSLTIHKQGNRAKALFALSLVCFFWGTTWVASKQGILYMPPLQLAGIRQFLGGSCYVIFFMIRGDKWPDKKQWQTILVLACLNFFLSNGLTTWGVKYISAGLAAIINAIFPLWLVVIGLFGPRMKISIKAVTGLLVGFSGVCIIFFEHLDELFNPDFRFGIILSLIATWSWALGTFYTKKQAHQFNPYFSLGLQMFVSGLSLMGISGVSGTSIPWSAIPWQSWAAIGYLVTFGSVISFIAYLYALQNLTTEHASIYAYINPVVAMLLGWMIFDEKLTVFIAIGGMVTLAGVYLVNKAYKIPAAAMLEPEGA
jgi:drug/metabolite transporter (DMT)-like permease